MLLASTLICRELMMYAWAPADMG